MKFGTLIQYHPRTKPVKFCLNWMKTLSRVTNINFHFLAQASPCDNSKTYNSILINFSGFVTNGTPKSWLDFGCVLPQCELDKKTNFFVYHAISMKFGALIGYHPRTKPVKFGVNKIKTLTRVINWNLKKLKLLDLNEIWSTDRVSLKD